MAYVILLHECILVRHNIDNAAKIPLDDPLMEGESWQVDS